MKLKAVLVFLAGLTIGGGSYHLLGGVARRGGDSGAGDGRGGSGLGSMLGTTEKPVAGAKAAAGAVAMPEGFEDVHTVSDIMGKAGPRDRFQAMMALVNGISTPEIEAALDEIRASMTSQFDPEAMFAMHLLLMRWGEEDPEAAFASLEKLDMMSRGFGSMSVLAAVASKNPNAAAEWMATNPLASFPRVGDFMATTVSKEWAKQDVNAALAWAKTLPEGKRAGAYNGVIGSLASEDPQRASAMALELEAGKDRQNLIGNIAESWGKKSPGEALAWAQTLEGDERSAAMGKALGGWAQNEPARAAAYLDQLPEEERAANVGAVAGPWARQDPSGAATWLVDQPEGEGKNDGMRQVMWMWTATEPEAASTWLAGQPEGPSRDHGIVSLASTTFDDDPAAAVTWAAAISDDGMRQEHLGRGVNRWMKDEPEAATRWLQTNEVLSAEERQSFLTPPTETPQGE